jgi:hypothetical protein
MRHRLQDAGFLETTDELDQMMASVGIAPIRKVSSTTDVSNESGDVLADLKKWRADFDE